MTILVIAEHDHASLKAATLNTIAAARKIGGDIHVLVAGSDCQTAAQQAASLQGVVQVKVADAAHYQDQTAENLSALVIAHASGYSHIFAPATTFGKNLAPRIAALLDVAQISEITGVESPDTFVRPIYAGNALATVKSADPVKVITVRTTAFDAVDGGNSAEIEAISPGPDIAQSTLAKRELTKSERPELGAARIIVSGGRGLGSGENYHKLLEPLADKLGALLRQDYDWTVQAAKLAVPVLIVVGDEVVATDHEYGACDAAWEWVCRRAGARYVRVAIPLPFRREEFADRIFAAATDRTRLIFLSHVTSTTALIFPVAEVCLRARERGILTLIDGAHAPGHIPLFLDELGADFYAGNCHKWLCAPKGAAFLYARPPVQPRLEPLVVSCGWALMNVGISAAAPVPQVTICHLPPGDPSNAQLITVGFPAVAAHVRLHGDAVCAAGNSDCCADARGEVCTNLASDVNNCGGCSNGCDDLAAHSFRRDPREWLLLTQGASGAGSIYDALCWLGARLRGEKFIRAHQPETVS